MLREVQSTRTEFTQLESSGNDSESLSGDNGVESSLDTDQVVSRVPSMKLSWNELYAYPVQKKSLIRTYCLERNVESIGKKSEEKKVLNNVFGTARPGEVLAIMGSSGAGKTSLLNTLTQRNTGTLRIEGNIKINGIPVTREHMKRVSAYVQQEDMFLGSLTVEEHLLFNARSRMSDKHSRKEQEERVREVMTELGLRVVAKSLIGTATTKGLSGGQKKRLAFACEILTAPPILLCDEPTSGLDSFLAFQVVSVLKKLAKRKGMTVVLTIHQPSSQVFELFDRIYLMAEGRVAFCGSQSEASSMFDVIGSPLPTNFNPADHYISTLAVKEEKTKAHIETICDHYEQSTIGIEMARDAAKGGESRQSDSSLMSGRREEELDLEQYHASWFVQLRVLIMRNLKTTIRNSAVYKLQVFQTVLIATILGIIFSGSSNTQKQVMNINGANWQLVEQMGFLFQWASIGNFLAEFTSYHREHSSNLYRVSTYFLAKNIAELPYYILTAVLFAVIMYPLTAIEILSWKFALYILVAVLAQNIGISFAYAVGCIFETTTAAVEALSFVSVPLMIFAGFFINRGDIPIYFMPLRFLSHMGYGYETLSISRWQDVEDISGNCTRFADCPKNGDDVIKSLSFNKEMMWPNVGFMLILLIVIRIIAFGGLYFKTKSKK